MPEILLHQSLRMMLNVRPIPSSIEYFIFQPKVCNLCPSIKATVAVEYPFVSKESGSSKWTFTPHFEATKEAKSFNRQSEIAVSYTHLTLPTKLEV